MPARQYSPDRLAAREEMRDAIHTYCRAIDRRQFRLMKQVFHDDAVMHCGPYVGDVDGFMAMLDERHGAIPRATHMIGNIMFDFIDDDHAFVESYCLALEEFGAAGESEGGINRVVRVRYADDFARVEDRWRISQRVIVIDHAMAPDPVGEAGFFRGPQGVRGAEDPIHARRAALGVAD